MKLQSKLIAGFGLIVAITVVVAGIGYWQAERLAAALYEVGVVRLPSVHGLNMMSHAMTVVDGSTRAILQESGHSGGDLPEELARQGEAWKEFDAGWQLYEPLPQTNEEAQLWRDFVPAARAWRSQHEAMIATLAASVRPRLSNRSLDVARHESADIAPLAAQAARLLNGITDLNFQIARKAMQRSVASYEDTTKVRRIMLGSAAIAVLAAIGLAVVLGRWLSQPVRDITAALAAVAQGNLDVRVPVRSRDEIGGAAQALNDMAASMRNSQELLRVLGDNLPASMLYQAVLEPDGRTRFHYLSAGVLALHGVTVADAMRDPELILGRASADDRLRLVEAQRKSLETMGVFNLEVRLCLPDGEVRWRHICSQPRRLPDGRTLWDGIETDITDRKRAESNLLESETRFRSIVANSTSGMALISLEGQTLSVNPALCRILGYTEAEIVALDPVHTTHPDDMAESRRQLDRLMAGEIDAYELEKRYLHRSGRVVWGYLHMLVMRDALGRALYFYSQIDDITERKLAAITLAESADRLRIALDVAQLGIWRRNLATGAGEWDDRVFEIFGRDPRQGVPSYAEFIDTILPEDRAAVTAAWQKLVSGEGKFDRQIRVRRADGAVRHLRAQATLQRDEAGQPLWAVGVEADLTELIKATEESGRLREQLRQAQKMETLGTLAAGVAHDFNNLLTGINGFIDMGSASLPPGHETVELLRHARRGTTSARNLVRRILAFSRRTTEDVRELVPLAQLVQDSAPLITAGLPSRVFLALELDRQAPPVLADLGQIQQVLLNLCVNSAHAIGETEGTIRLGLAERLVTEGEPVVGTGQVRPGRYVCLTVSDTGCGMTPEVCARIFEPFFTTKKSGEGTGLGLAMVQEIVTEHGGGIAVRSSPGQGTTFEVLLPVAAPAPTA